MEEFPENQWSRFYHEPHYANQPFQGQTQGHHPLIFFRSEPLGPKDKQIVPSIESIPSNTEEFWYSPPFTI